VAPCLVDLLIQTQAIRELDGIGKTQTVREYARLYEKQYDSIL